MKISFLIFVAVLIILNVLQTSLQYIDKDQVEQAQGFYKDVYSAINVNRLPASIIIALLASLLPIYKEYVGPKQIKNNVKTTIMETISSNVFDGDQLNIRITIFKDISWFRLFTMFLRENLTHPIRWFKDGKKPPPKFGSYIITSKRIGSENPNPNTYFYFSLKTHKECEGIAGYVRNTRGEFIEENLPNLNHLNLEDIDLTRNTIDAKNVKKYMERGKIKDIETLKRLQIKARHFYGNALYNSKSELVGVLVIDCDQEQSPFSETTISKLGGFVKLFSAAF